MAAGGADPRRGPCRRRMRWRRRRRRACISFSSPPPAVAAAAPAAVACLSRDVLNRRRSRTTFVTRRAYGRPARRRRGRHATTEAAQSNPCSLFLGPCLGHAARSPPVCSPVPPPPSRLTALMRLRRAASRAGLGRPCAVAARAARHAAGPIVRRHPLR
eukprot:364993-Chlamydomonas_euryale.AAC.4